MVAEAADAAEIREQLREIGCSTEGSHIPRLFSVDIPAEVDYTQVRELLQAGAETDRWDYEEAALADHVS